MLNPSLIRPASTYTFRTGAYDSSGNGFAQPIDVDGSPINPSGATVTVIFTPPATLAGAVTFIRSAALQSDNSWAYTTTTTDFPLAYCAPGWRRQWRLQIPTASPPIDITEEAPVFFEVRAS